MLPTFVLSLLASAVAAQLTDSNLEKHVGSLSLSASFNPIQDSYWTGLPHHRRTPFAVSPDGKSAYLAYLDASKTGVHIQKVDPTTFAAVGAAVTVAGGKEAGGLVAHNDGFALLTNEAMPSGTANAPADSTPVAVLYRYTGEKQTFKTWLGGPGIDGGMGNLATPDINGDLAFSEASGMYGAYFVVTAYSGDAKGHFGDAIQYVNENGTLEQIPGASSGWGCSHNTGIAFEAADSVPFASLCAEDQGAIWLNTGTSGMDRSGVKVSNENVQNGASNEPMGGMGGSYSGLARFINSDSYIFSWVSRGAKDLSLNDWMGAGYTKSVNRTVNRNVAIATFSNKKTIVGEQATSTLGGDGDKQINWITTGSADCQNAHVAAFDGKNALVTWEEIAQPTCEFIAMGCKGKFTGAYYQLVSDGKKVGAPIKTTDTFVAGDMVTMADGRICWPYVNMNWTLDGPVQNPASVKAISFACMGLKAGSGSVVASSSSSASQTPAAAAATPVKSAVAASATPVVSSAVATSAAPVRSSTTPIRSSTTPVKSSTKTTKTSTKTTKSSTKKTKTSTKTTKSSTKSVRSAAAEASSVEESAESSDVPTDAYAPVQPSASAAPELPAYSALPTFELATSGATITPPATSINLDLPNPTLSFQLPSSESFIASEAPAFSLSIGTPLPAFSSVATVTAALPTDYPSQLPDSAYGSGFPTEYPTQLPESAYGSGFSTGAPVATSAPVVPSPSVATSSPSAGRPDYNNGRPGFGWGRPRPSGWGSWGSGRPRPTGSLFSPEKGDFGLPKASSTPCTLETKVRPTATATPSPVSY